MGERGDRSGRERAGEEWEARVQELERKTGNEREGREKKECSSKGGR